MDKETNNIVESIDENKEPQKEPVVDKIADEKFIKKEIKNKTLGNVKDSKIILNQPKKDLKAKDSFISGDGKVRGLMIYAFSIFVVVLLVLVALRKL